MRIEQACRTVNKGWYIGPWNSNLSSSPDYFHFVIHTPGLVGEEAQREKTAVSHARLGL